VVLVACVMQVLAVPAAAAASPIEHATASTSSFIPDWDGHTDAAVVSYRLRERSAVTMLVTDPRGRLVLRRLLGTLDAGDQAVAWDGRGVDGVVRAPGRYVIRIDAVPAAGAGARPDAAALGGPSDAAGTGARSVTVTLQRAAVTLTSVQLSRTALGRSAGASSARARFRLSARASVSAAIVDDGGRVVRTLMSGTARAGTSDLTWSGRAADGREVVDGTYALVVSATAGARPTSTSRVAIVVDRTDPTVAMARSVRAGVRGTAVRLALPVALNEAGSVRIRHGRRSMVASVASGRRVVDVLGERLGLRAGPRARVVSLTVLVSDAAGNSVGRRISVTIPPRTRTATPRPTSPAPTTPTKPGTWPWPVAGLATSEFGLRNGRPHTGIDIAAPAGTPIHPSAPGTVSFVGVLGGYGNLVIVEHAGGTRTYYAHLSQFGSFAVGATVSHVDVLGLVGCTGSCTGPHVHFEVRVADTPRDPRGWLVAG
jgi:murein DD-endopeptidase MepM/ murein hydrolase activator NlpD